MACLLTGWFSKPVHFTQLPVQGTDVCYLQTFFNYTGHVAVNDRKDVAVGLLLGTITEFSWKDGV